MNVIPSSAGGDDQHRLRKPSRLRSICDGSTRLTHLPDGELQIDPARWFTGTEREIPQELLDDDGMLVAGIGALLVQRGGRAMLIDAGVGAVSRCGDPSGLTGRWRGGALLESLHSVGVDATSIDCVAVTHIHIDHVGWLLGTEGESAFAGARVAVAAEEWAAREQRANADISRRALNALAPQVDVFTPGQTIWPGVVAVSAPGHTAGHTVFEIDFDGGVVLALGDAMHSPLQIARPSWEVAADEDPAQACETRLALRDRLSEPGITGYAVHFADVVFGRVAAVPHSSVDSGWSTIDSPRH